MRQNKVLEKLKLDAALITKQENVRYLTDFIGTFGQAFLTKNKTYLITDKRYALQAKKLCHPDVEIIILENYEEDLNKLIKKHKVKTLGCEDTATTYSRYKKLKELLKDVKLKPVKKEIDYLRAIKTDEEISKIKKSQEINEKTLTEIRKFIVPDVTESELAWKIISIGRDFGAEGVSFDPIVAFGQNSASPHYMPTDSKYKKGQSVLIDMGMVYKGYCSDMSRTFLPKDVTNEMVQVYNIVLAAQENCIKNLRPGMKGSKGDKLSRSIIEKADYGEYFTHANGHGVGLEIHEAPSLSFKEKHKDRTMTIEENMVVTVEPGIYLENKFGVRIEDMILIGAEKNENLTKFPKDIKDITIQNNG